MNIRIWQSGENSSDINAGGIGNPSPAQQTGDPLTSAGHSLKIHTQSAPQQAGYLQFLQAHQLTRHEALAFDHYIDHQTAPPEFEIAIACTPATLNELVATLRALARQLYSRARITIIGDGPAPAAIAASPNLNWINSATPWPDISRLFESSNADWLLLLDAGDEIVEHALPYVAELGLRCPEVGLIYVDEDQRSAAGYPDQPYFKPDFSPDYLLAFPYLGDGVFVRRTAMAEVGGLRTQDYGDPFHDLALRLHVTYGDAAITHLPDVLYRRHPVRSLSRDLGGQAGTWRALSDYLQTSGQQDVTFKSGLLPGSSRLRRPLQAAPKIAIIAQAPANLAACRQLVEHTFLQRIVPDCRLLLFVPMDAPADILQYMIDADSAGAEGLEIYQSHPGQGTLQGIDAAIRQTDAEVIVLLRAGLQPTTPEWLPELAVEALREEIGAVAPRIVDPKGKVVGNALILGCTGLANRFGHDTSFDAWGHFGRQLVAQNPSALTFDALALRRRTYLERGGFDLKLDPVSAAIDFGQRIRQGGQRLLWLPDITLVATTPQTESISETSEHILLERWLPQLSRDPFYNRNLSRSRPFALVDNPQVSRLRLPWKPLPRLLAFPADLMGCGHYRVIEPFNAALNNGHIDGYLGVDHYNPFDLSLFDADTLLLQRQVTDGQLRFLSQYRKFFQLRLVYELDDLITNVPASSFHKSHIPKDIARRLRTGLSLCDRFIVSTEALAEAYRHFNSDIRVVPNRIDVTKWGHLQPLRRAGKKMRVGWAGGVSHGGDLAEIASVVKELADEVEWVFMGMCPDSIRPYVSEFHAGVPTPDYPAKLASLNLDLAIAPIEHNDFNECKSNLKLLEYGILGYPVIASNFGPYRCGFPVTLVKNRSRDWISAIREHLADPEALARQGDTLRAHVRANWLLQDHLDEWMDAWFKF
ncbi:hypothetical protein [Azoarcus taiwanensis]|uniref:Glycosyltransferase n=1 Tax=Azoarcus taiwanensis TaxID=666964 RepID=A0A972F8Z3_9RHOO|nr:hypothetical protein [Azoarcus taiwanensis]NMG04257.1 hypothetical protein [Azoarcus taiwanensis]